MIKTIVVSEIKIYCEGISHFLSAAQSIVVTCAFNDGEKAIAFIKEDQPDVVLLDMATSGSCGLAQQIHDLNKDINIVALAVPYDEKNIIQCAEVGITGYVPREASIDELIEAVMRAARGECYCPPKIAACILNKVRQVAASAKRKCLSPIREVQQEPSCLSALYDNLTRRERQIASLLAKGLSNKQIARNLSIEVSTVKNHVHNVLVKLDVKSRNQAMSLLQQNSRVAGSESLDLDHGLELSSCFGSQI
jgi:DNA-binding NarL/FixJ family response regulator